MTVINILFANKPANKSPKVFSYDRSRWSARDIVVENSRATGQLFDEIGTFVKNFNVAIKDGKFSMSLGPDCSGLKVYFTL